MHLEVPPEALLSKQKEEENIETDEIKENPDILEGTSNEESSITSKIDQLEKHQKQTEEENKRKRQLLVQAIADRRQRTSEEAKKLQNVQSELQRLDVIVAQDVKILRKTI